jgi:hypothetical protein
VRRPRTWWLAGVLAGGALAMAGCDAGQVQPAALPVVEAGPPISAIAQDPRAYIGKRATVHGEVDRVLGTHAFVLDGDAFVGGKDLLVVTNDTLPLVEERAGSDPLRAHDLVLVSGMVRQFQVADAERELRIQLDDAQLADWTGTAAIVATRVDVTPRTEAWRQANSSGASREDSSLPLVPIARITGDPETFVGRIVRVAGTVDEAQGRLFTLDGPGTVFDDDLLVVAPMPATAAERQAAPQREAQVQVIGTVRTFDLASLQREFGADLFPSGFISARWTGRPVIAAQSVVRQSR